MQFQLQENLIQAKELKTHFICKLHQLQELQCTDSSDFKHLNHLDQKLFILWMNYMRYQSQLNYFPLLGAASTFSLNYKTIIISFLINDQIQSYLKSHFILLCLNDS